MRASLILTAIPIQGRGEARRRARDLVSKRRPPTPLAPGGGGELSARRMSRLGGLKPEDSYSVLGVKQDATSREIASAYRNLALKYHPDKNPSPEAAQRFEAISQAYGVLMDTDARRALDAVIASHRAVEEREAALGGLRRAMRDDLLRREQAARKRKLEEEAAQANLCRELDRLRREAKTKERPISPLGPTAPPLDDRDRTLKVSIKRNIDRGDSPLVADTLRDLLSLHGEICDIVISPKGTTGLVVFKDVPSAKSVMTCFERGDFGKSGLEIAWAKGHPPPELTDEMREGSRLPQRDAESLTLMRMRQHAERAKLRAKLAADSNNEDVSKSAND